MILQILLIAGVCIFFFFLGMCIGAGIVRSSMLKVYESEIKRADELVTW